MGRRIDWCFPFFPRFPNWLNKIEPVSPSSGLIQVPDHASSGTNPARRIFALHILRFASKRRQNFAFVFSGDQKRCVKSLIQDDESQSHPLRRLGGRRNCQHPASLLIESQRTGEQGGCVPLDSEAEQLDIERRRTLTEEFA